MMETIYVLGGLAALISAWLVVGEKSLALYTKYRETFKK